MKLSLQWLNRRAVRSKNRMHQAHLRGFSLVELSVTVTILAIVATFGLEGMASFIDRTNGQVTKERLVVVDDALRNYFRIYGRLPCPALRTTTIETATYGLEDCSIAVAAGTTVGGGIVFGALPFRALNLPMNHSVDGWNNKLNYVVTKNLTLAGTGNAQFGKDYVVATPTANDGMAGVEIRSGKLEQPCSGTNCQVVANPTYDATNNPNPNGAAYVVFSNGLDQRGAISIRGVPRKNCAEASTNDTLKIDAQNCLNDATGTVATSGSTPANAAVTAAIPRNVFYDSKYNSGLANTFYFDDYIVWRQRGQL